MKKINSIFYAAIILFVVSCSNESTDKSEQSTTTPTETTPSAPAASTPPATPPAAPKRDNVELKKDTPRTEISIGQKGGSVKTKKGTDVSVDDKGVKVGTPDVRIDIKRDTI